jgi:hypothetical protein
MARSGGPTEEGKGRMKLLIAMPTRTRGLAGWQLKLQWRSSLSFRQGQVFDPQRQMSWNSSGG